MKFHEKLTMLRKEKGMSQEELAEKLEVSRQAVSRWEAGSTLPDAGNLLKLSDLFCVRVDTLLRDALPLDTSAGSVALSSASGDAAQEPADAEVPLLSHTQDCRKRDRYIAWAVLCLLGALVLTLLCFGVRVVTGFGKLMIFLLPPFAACMFGAGFFAVKAARQKVVQDDPRRRDKLIIATAGFFLAGVVFLATGWVYWNYIAGGLWLMWLHLGLGAVCLFAAGFCGFRLYLVTHSATEEDKTQAQARLAFIAAVLNLIAAVCFSFVAGLSDRMTYWFLTAVLTAGAVMEFSRFRKLKYGK